MPRNAEDLNIKLLTFAHARKAGHLCTKATAALLQKIFTAKNVSDDATDCLPKYLLCIISQGRAQVPRLLDTTLHAHVPEKLLHFDQLFLEESSNYITYVFVLKDDPGRYEWMCAAAQVTVSHTARLLAH